MAKIHEKCEEYKSESYYKDKYDISLFKPFTSPEIVTRLQELFSTRWIGQGPKVDIFEKQFSARVCDNYPCIAVAAGTHALHLAYKLTDLLPGDEVIAPVFTCAATNIPFLWEKVRIKFVDIEKQSMNIDTSQIEKNISENTKLIVCVHYGGYPCDLNALQRIEAKYGIPVIQDCAQAIGAVFNGKPISRWSMFSTFSFQAIKHITTGDGGMLCINSHDHKFTNRARKLRWFGIDRTAKFNGSWNNNIDEIGYKYHMNDIAATLGVAALPYLDTILSKRIKLLKLYENRLSKISGIKYFSGKADPKDGKYIHAAWLCTVLVEDRNSLIKKLNSSGIEAQQVHFRNDTLSIFKNHRNTNSFPNMTAVEGKYLVLPLHHQLTTENVDYICDIIEDGW